MDVLAWLLDSDPSIRWQAMRDLTGEPADTVAAERARVATEGWGARLLALQAADGRWGGAAWSHDWTDTMHTLELLRLLGLDPDSEEARRAIGLVRDHVTWQGGYPGDVWDGNPFFTGEVEPCINGRVVAIGAYFGEDVWPLVDRLLGEQLADGGWNCEAERGSTVGSFGTTINVLEGLQEYERAMAGPPEVTAARLRGEEYLLQRRLFRRRSTSEVIDPDWLLFSFPAWHFYDVLRGLDELRASGGDADDRVEEAIEVVERNRGADGWWPLQNVHAGATHFDLEDGEGAPSRWNTLRAMRVLGWAQRGLVGAGRTQA
jgi:hypothetical protein